jgi:hydroxypyruvate reductase
VTDVLRAQLADFHAVGVRAVQGERVLAGHGAVVDGHWMFRRGGRALHLPLPDRARGGRLRVIGLGKAAFGMARGFRRSLQAARLDVDDGLLIVRDLPCDPGSTGPEGEPWRVLAGDHPLPGPRSEQAARALLEFIGQPSAADRFVVLLSGGASALCALPAPGVTLEEKRRITSELMHSGAPIAAINRVRRQLSALKGGKLAARLAPAQFVTLAISDVPDDEPAVIGSAPTWRDDLPATSQPPYVVIAGLDDALEAMAQAAAAAGFVVTRFGRCLYGSVTTEVPRILAAIESLSAQGDRPQLLLAGGEPLVEVRGGGRGGRAQELALRLGVALSPGTGGAWAVHDVSARRQVGIVGLVAGTDGSDGPTAAAGGFFDAATPLRVAAAGLDLARVLADNDSHTALEAIGDLFVTGPTGTNVADVLMVVIPGG